MEVRAKDLRAQTKRLLESVDRGEEVIVTYRGKARAKIVPLGSESPSWSDDVDLFGIWRDRDDLEDVERYVDELRKART